MSLILLISRHKGVLYPVLSDFIPFFNPSYFLSQKLNSKANSSLTSKMTKGILCWLFSLTQKAVGTVFLFWNPFLCRYFPVTWQWMMLGMFSIPNICSKGLASFRTVLHSTALVWETFCMTGLLRRLQVWKKKNMTKLGKVNFEMKNEFMSIWQCLYEIIFFSRIQIIGNQLCSFCEWPFGVPRFPWCCCDAFQTPLLLYPAWCFHKEREQGVPLVDAWVRFGHCSYASLFFCLGAEEKHSDYSKS